MNRLPGRPGLLAQLPEGGIRQTALHNHLQRESPKVMYLHSGGHGDPVRSGESKTADR